MTPFRLSLARLSEELALPSPVDVLTPDWPGSRDLHLMIKRDDCIHPIISGNKWRKLSATLSQLTTAPARIISFGGGFSNHLHALGYVCARLNIPFTAIIRGDYRRTPSPMIRDLTGWRTDIRYVTKLEYRQRHTDAYIAALHARYPGALIIPEGGSQDSALRGVRQLISEHPVDFDTVVCPVASGATLAGIVSALTPQQRAIGIAVLNGENYLEPLVGDLLATDLPNWHIEHDFTHGGYARSTPELTAFCHAFADHTRIAIEPVYSGKLFFALHKMIAAGRFDAGERILAVHTGGLQGARKH